MNYHFSSCLTSSPLSSSPLHSSSPAVMPAPRLLPVHLCSRCKRPMDMNHQIFQNGRSIKTCLSCRERRNANYLALKRRREAEAASEDPCPLPPSTQRNQNNEEYDNNLADDDSNDGTLGLPRMFKTPLMMFCRIHHGRSSQSRSCE